MHKAYTKRAQSYGPHTCGHSMMLQQHMRKGSKGIHAVGRRRRWRRREMPDSQISSLMSKLIIGLYSLSHSIMAVHVCTHERRTVCMSDRVCAIDNTTALHVNLQRMAACIAQGRRPQVLFGMGGTNG